MSLKNNRKSPSKNKKSSKKKASSRKKMSGKTISYVERCEGEIPYIVV